MDSTTTPVVVSGITTAIAISAGGDHTCALLSDGTVKCCGYNGYGQLGSGPVYPKPITVKWN
jgi:alpha-tubulin suppressor-like RCC1 family protein